MKKNVHKWRSPSLGKTMKLAIYGDSGTPILGLPTRGATCNQWNEFGMVDAISYQLENGFNQLFCLSSVDEESFLNKEATPQQRIIRQQQYESFLVEEAVPYINEQATVNYLIIAGVDLGGYQALNIALKHPNSFGKAIGISGVYDINWFMDDFYNDDVYYSNPIDFIPNLNKQPLLSRIREVDFRVVSFDKDERLEEAKRMSNVLRMKFIEHELDIWNMDSADEWDLWPQMLKTHIV